MNGLPFKSNIQIEGASLLDIAPTMLYILGLPISREIEGKILKAACKNEFVQTNTPKYVDQYEPFEPMKMGVPFSDKQLKERLRTLGYID